MGCPAFSCREHSTWARQRNEPSQHSPLWQSAETSQVRRQIEAAGAPTEAELSRTVSSQAREGLQRKSSPQASPSWASPTQRAPRPLFECRLFECPWQLIPTGQSARPTHSSRSVHDPADVSNDSAWVRPCEGNVMAEGETTASPSSGSPRNSPLNNTPPRKTPLNNREAPAAADRTFCATFMVG